MIKNLSLFAVVALALLLVAVFQSPSVALSIIALCLISAVMSLGVNIQWGYAGLFNVGTMGFAALGGVAVVIISMPPVGEAWRAGGALMLTAGLTLFLTAFAIWFLMKRMAQGNARKAAILAVVILGYIASRWLYGAASGAIEAVDPARTGYLGGLGLPVLLSWIVGGFFAAGAAWIVGKITLGLRSDYLAIATLGISEIIIALFKNEDWLTRGVKNVTGLPRPVPYEIELQTTEWFISLCERYGLDPVSFSSHFVKLCYIALFVIVLGIFLWLSETALKSPWGRMMRAIRDNETAANAMGKNVTKRHLQVFVLGSAIIGVGGAMLVTYDGQFTPGSYVPLRYTFLIWAMVIIGGSGNNWGSVLGAFIVWFLWIEAEPLGRWLVETLTIPLGNESALRAQLIENAAHMRMVFMGVMLLLVLRFAPKGLIPEKTARGH